MRIYRYILHPHNIHIHHILICIYIPIPFWCTRHARHVVIFGVPDKAQDRAHGEGSASTGGLPGWYSELPAAGDLIYRSLHLYN